MRKSVKIITDHSSVVSGLKCLLHETASTLFTNLSEDYFNVDAQPFVPVKKPIGHHHRQGAIDHQKILNFGLNSKVPRGTDPSGEQLNKQSTEKDIAQ